MPDRAPPESLPTVRFDLNGQVALVTGAARGLGSAIALALAQAGADVVLGLRERASGEALAATIRRLGRRALPVQMDIKHRAQISAAVAEAIAHFGRIDILVNNAGIGPPAPAIDVTEADFDDTLNVNLKGTFFVSQEVGRHMLQNRYGKIVMLSSQAGFVGLPTESVYCMTKAAIAQRAYSRACSSQKAPALGSLRSHSPSDSPGRLSHKKPSARGSPVSVVGGRPILRPGGLHHVSVSFFAASYGPAPLRLVSTMKCLPPTSAEISLP